MKFQAIGFTAFLWFMATCIFAAAGAVNIVVGGMHVTASAISPDTFRINVNANGPAKPIASVYLDPKRADASVGQLTEARGRRRITTSAGVLDIDPAMGTYSLLDAHGNVLIPPAPIATPSSDHSPSLNLHIGWPANRPFAIYGCGNGTNSLVQHAVKARVGNGIAVEPYFWSPAGFATFVVGTDANAPAQCDGQVKDVTVTWVVPATSADLYLIIAPTLLQATQGLLNLTGHPPVPPRWAFGYIQGRWGWVDKAYIINTLAKFITLKLPVDAFEFDFGWYTSFPDYDVPPKGAKGFDDFGWNPKLFPDPAKQLQQMHHDGVHFVGIRKPRIGNSKTLTMLRAKGWTFQKASGFQARDIQFSNLDVRTWYARQLEPLLRDGVDGWWDDEGELTYTDYIYWNMAERQALDAVHPHGRLWTIDRAFGPGLSRTGAAAWTGDIHANWHDLAKTPTTLLNWSLAGMPYCGCDIGGFSGQTTPQLLVRWMQAGTFFPVMRSHSELIAKPHFPWNFGPKAEDAMRKTLDLRMRLVPLLYSLAHNLQKGGDPIMRPLLMQYPADARVANLSTEWLIGQNLLVAPMLSPLDHRSIYLPNDIWYDFSTGQRVKGGRRFDRQVPFDAVTVYVRGGTILPLAPLVQHTDDLPGGPLDLQVYPGRDGHFTLDEDDGATTAYQSGQVRRTRFSWKDASRTLSWKREGSYDGSSCFKLFCVTLHGETSKTVAERPLTPNGSLSISK